MSERPNYRTRHKTRVVMVDGRRFLSTDAAFHPALESPNMARRKLPGSIRDRGFKNRIDVLTKKDMNSN